MKRAIVAALAAAVLLPGSAMARPTDYCDQACEQRVKARFLEEHYQRVWRAAPAHVRAHLRSIARCESGGNHRAVSHDGRFRGLLQFSPSTWATVGGEGDPAAATRWEQWSRGVRLYRSRGPSPWPVCQHR